MVRVVGLRGLIVWSRQLGFGVVTVGFRVRRCVEDAGRRPMASTHRLLPCLQEGVGGLYKVFTWKGFGSGLLQRLESLSGVGASR